MKIQINGVKLTAINFERRGSSMAVYFKRTSPASADEIKLWHLPKGKKVDLSFDNIETTGYLAGYVDLQDGRRTQLNIIGIYDSEAIQEEYPNGWRI